MGTIGERIVVPTLNQLIDLNDQLIEETGGYFRPPDNLRNTESLQWVLETIQQPVLFGHDPYPEIDDKGALLAWTIINGHIFHDGNKRTGMASLRILLLTNGYDLVATDKHIVEAARDIVRHKSSGFTRVNLSRWVRMHKIVL